jgi:hypothetical protein
MSPLDALKNTWQEKNDSTKKEFYNHETFNKMIQQRIKKQRRMMMRYFWGAFTFHIIVFAMLSHVIIRYWSDNIVLILAVTGLILTIPFTTVMMKRYKRLARINYRNKSFESLQEYISKQKEILSGFFRFKQRYEFMLIPLQAAIGVFITFRLFVPGGVTEHILGALITYGITLWSCIAAIRNENKKNFIQPLQDMDRILDEYKALP